MQCEQTLTHVGEVSAALRGIVGRNGQRPSILCKIPGVSGVIQSTNFPAALRKYVCLTLFLCASLATIGARSEAQSADRASEIERVALDWTGSGKNSTAVKDRVAEKLKAYGKIQIVKDAAQADAVLHGSATIWTTGYVSTSPRSHSTAQAVYQGYATAELSGDGGKTLWSYLATPRRPEWKSITDDLGDQLGIALVEALKRKEAGENAASLDTADAGKSSALAVALQGAGATFPAPIYMKWFASFGRTRPEIHITYEATGSEQGIRRMRAGDVDFGASDMPLSEGQLQEHGKFLQFATVLGAVVPIYNVKGAPDGLNLTPEVLTGIFLGSIRTWNAPEIRAINKHVHLPDEKIVVVHRSDGSGTTFAWTDYLSKVSPEWKSSVGAGTTVTWPVGMGAERNQGVADTVFKTPNSIGYVEFIYALQHELSFGTVRNLSGEYVKADLDSVTAAAKAGEPLKESEFQTSITNATGKHAYPISTFTWVLIPAEAKDAKKQEAVREMVRWMLTSGQKECQSLGYAPLPGDLAERELQVLGNGK
jgi:phosphate ABC transporter phosphate-binding protein